MTEMLTSKEMQAILHVDRSTIYRMAESGRLPAIKVGKQWRFPKQQVEAWLKTQGTAAAPGNNNSHPAATPEPAAAAAAAPAAPGSEFSEMFPLQCVQQIQDTFADALGVMVVITDIDGRPVTEVSNPCGLFEVVSQSPDALDKCLQHWRDLAHTIDLEPKFTASHLGLLCARAMVRVGAQLKGMVFVGGIAPKNWPPSPERITTIEQEFGVPRQDFMPHLNEVFTLDEAEQRQLLSFVQRIANIVAHIINERNSLMGQQQAQARLAIN
ncbi:MAG: hypothetical protein Kow0031_29120 [Anaerolineae bacterium]